jgi:hypothetical protein
MRARRRVVLLVALILLGGVAALLWSTRHKRESGVTLLFVGFTNTSLRAGQIPAVILLATNTGRVAVELQSLVRTSFSNRRPARHLAYSLPSPAERFPRILKPGEDLMIRIECPDPRGAWWPEVWYQRYGMRERLLRLTLALRKPFAHPRIQSLFSRISPRIQVAPLKQATIDNRPIH